MHQQFGETSTEDGVLQVARDSATIINVFQASSAKWLTLVR
jgi:hypothetical protein